MPVVTYEEFDPDELHPGVLATFMERAELCMSFSYGPGAFEHCVGQALMTAFNKAEELGIIKDLRPPKEKQP